MKSSQSGYGVVFDTGRQEINLSAGQYYTLPANSAQYAPTGDFTVEGYFRFTTSVASIFFWGCSNGSGAVPKLGCYTDASGHVQVDISGGPRITSTLVLSTNTTYHIAVCRVGNVTTLYINGTVQGTDNAARTISPLNNAWNIGWFDEGSINFAGSISQFRYVNGTALYTAAFSPPRGPLPNVPNTKILVSFDNSTTDASPVGATLTKQGSGTPTFSATTVANAVKFGAIADPLAYATTLLLHGNGSNGSTTFLDTSRNQTITRTGTGTTISTTQSKFGGSSINFTGATGNYLSTAASTYNSMGTSNFTYEFWMWPDSTSNTALNIPLSNFVHPIVFTNNAWGFYYNRSGNTKTLAIFCFNANNAAPIIESSAGLITDQAWNHIALVRNGATLTLYINGTSAGTYNIGTTSWDSYGSLAFYVGAGSTNGSVAYPFKGYIEEVRVSKVARWTTNFTPPAAEYADYPIF